MSAILYGKLVRKQTEDAVKGAAVKGDAGENKLATAIAALIPAEIIALHGLVLSRTTTTGADGSTAITQPETLKWSLIVLLVVTVGVYLIGRGLKDWQNLDYIRAVVPPFAFLAWTGLLGTSALTPWVLGQNQTYVCLGAGVLAVVLIAVHGRINPPKPAPPLGQ